MSTLATVPDVETQLGTTDYKLLQECMFALAGKRVRNTVRATYYDMHNMFRDLGISLPPSLRNLEVASGWNAKAVDSLARRIRDEGYVLPGGDVESWGIPIIEADNRSDVEFPQAVTSTLMHPPSFIVTAKGDVEDGEPEVLMTYADANQATGIWHPVKRSLSAWVHVKASDAAGVPVWLNFVTPTTAYGIRKQPVGWEVRVQDHRMGRVPVEPLVYRPRIGRPFGCSRITRAMMSITDSAMRTMARSEAGAEFFSVPQRWAMGADASDFVNAQGENVSQWSVVMGRMLALSRDEDGNMPEVGQFPQVSMQPHTDHFRMWATAFAGEANLPVSALGVVQDNPSSAEAIYAAKEELVMDAEDACTTFTPARVRAMQTAVQMRDGLTSVPPELRALGLRWRDPSTPSRSAATDAVMKQITAGALPAESDVTLEALGYDRVTVARIQAERRRARAVGRSVDLQTRAAARAQQPVIPLAGARDNAG